MIPTVCTIYRGNPIIIKYTSPKAVEGIILINMVKISRLPVVSAGTGGEAAAAAAFAVVTMVASVSASFEID
jgi:hypothetical protein